MSIVDITHFHLFCGLGGGAAGFNDGEARVGNMQARFRCLGGIDSDSAAIEDFNQLSGSVGTVLDLFDRDQYIKWHGHEPPADWRECTPDDIRKAAGNERPNIVFTSAPCKGFSGLLSQKRSTTDKYQALNRLTLRGIWLTLEAWHDDPPEFILFENVPRIATRGRNLLDQIVELLHHYGYATAETTHDCGELGGLAQSRKRFLLVARHVEKVPPFLYEPRKRPLRAVGDILGPMPMPGSAVAGPMHRIPELQWKTWVRLALVEAGKDWRSLARLNVVDGVLADYGIMPDVDYHAGCLGVRRWDETTGTVAGRSSSTNGAFSVADPRYSGENYKQYGVIEWGDPTGTITGQRSPGQGPFAVADPRCRKDKHNNCFRVVDFEQAAGTVTGGIGPSSGGQCVSDPRPPASGFNGKGKYRVVGFDQTSGTVISGSTTGQGAFAVADPRPGFDSQRKHYQTGGHFGVLPWDDPAYAVTGKAKHDTGRFSVADPRPIDARAGEILLPEARDRGAFIIQSMDDTWHRPFTTLELAALQGLVDGEEYVELHGESDSAWRERIGNAVPRQSAAAIASVMGRTLMLSWSGQTFVLDTQPIWVQPIAVALSVGIHSEWGQA